MAAVSSAMAIEERRPLSSATLQDSPHLGSHTPLSINDFDPNSLHEPRPPFLSGTQTPGAPSLRDSYAQPGTPTESGLLLANKESMPSSDDDLGPTRALDGQPRKRRRFLLVLISLLVLLVLIVAVVVPVYFTVIKPKANVAAVGGTTGPATPTSSSRPKSPTTASGIWGGDGSKIKTSNGTTFTYHNTFGGICEFPFILTQDYESSPYFFGVRLSWYSSSVIMMLTNQIGYSDPSDPYNNNAYPNSWTPPLNQSWDYTNNRIFG